MKDLFFKVIDILGFKGVFRTATGKFWSLDSEITLYSEITL